MVPSLGRIVHYTLSEGDASAIEDQRKLKFTESASRFELRLHGGNGYRAGDVVAAVIVRVWGAQEGSAANLQLLLDGDDTLWVTSRTEGDVQGRWFVPPRVG